MRDLARFNDLISTCQEVGSRSGRGLGRDLRLDINNDVAERVAASLLTGPAVITATNSTILVRPNSLREHTEQRWRCIELQSMRCAVDLLEPEQAVAGQTLM
jgi:hypothetical protein